MNTVTFLLVAVLSLAAALVAVSVLAVSQSVRARREGRRALDYAHSYAALLTALPIDQGNEIVRAANEIRAAVINGGDVGVAVSDAFNKRGWR